MSESSYKCQSTDIAPGAIVPEHLNPAIEERFRAIASEVADGVVRSPLSAMKDRALGWAERAATLQDALNETAQRLAVAQRDYQTLVGAYQALKTEHDAKLVELADARTFADDIQKKLDGAKMRPKRASGPNPKMN